MGVRGGGRRFSRASTTVSRGIGTDLSARGPKFVTSYPALEPDSSRCQRVGKYGRLPSVHRKSSRVSLVVHLVSKLLGRLVVTPS